MEKSPYAYEDMDAMNYLLYRYNQFFALNIDEEYMSIEDFPTKEQISEANRLTLKYHNQILFHEII